MCVDEFNQTYFRLIIRKKYSNMNQLITHNNLNDGLPSRRYTGFPLNSTLVSSYTADTIRSVINQAANGKPYST